MVDLALADLVPRQPHRHAGAPRVAALGPEQIIAAMPCRLARIVVIAIDGAERGPREAAQRTRVRFAMIEEGMTDNSDE